jgi:hypothetical protein
MFRPRRRERLFDVILQGVLPFTDQAQGGKSFGYLEQGNKEGGGAI